MLDGALDRCTSEQIFEHREHERLAGCALVTDESPPSQPRFRGLRFQITVLYWGVFVPLEDWETCSEPPILVRTCLGDIMHCHGKKGADVNKCLETSNSPEWALIATMWYQEQAVGEERTKGTLEYILTSST